eukprot:g81320.t1
MPVIKYNELDPQPAKLDIAGLIFSHHKAIPGMYQSWSSLKHDRFQPVFLNKMKYCRVKLQYTSCCFLE